MGRKMNLLHEYKNGNYRVQIFDDGTKIRETDSTVFLPTIPESMDVKITNQCSLSCKWCHEGSVKDGDHADTDFLLGLFDWLPGGVELAIGGGNPLAHPDLECILFRFNKKGLIPNITVNELHLAKYMPIIDRLVASGLVYGIGVTYSGNDLRSLERINAISKNVVYHMIAGVHNVHDVVKAPKVLVLGYKRLRKGEDFFSQSVEDNMYQWYTNLPKYLGKVPISFDNLAIEQMKVRRLLKDDDWNTFYMGDDGTFTFYIDAVRQEYASSSTDMDRRSAKNKTAIEMFSDLKRRPVKKGE